MTDPLADLLHELGIGCMQPFAVTRDMCVPSDPRYADFHPALAARLRDHGVTLQALLQPVCECSVCRYVAEHDVPRLEDECQHGARSRHGCDLCACGPHVTAPPSDPVVRLLRVIGAMVEHWDQPEEHHHWDGDACPDRLRAALREAADR